MRTRVPHPCPTFFVGQGGEFAFRTKAPSRFFKFGECPRDKVTTEPYSCVKHTALAVFLSRWRDSFMAMFIVYFDASGAPDQGVALSVAGFVARTEEWIKFEKSWRIVLNAYKVKALHMKEFGPGAGEFARWKDDKRQRKEFLQDLIGVIAARCANSFVNCVMLEPFREMDKKYRLSERHKPLALAGTASIDKVLRWATRKRIDQNQITVAFEDGDKDKGDLMRCCESEFGFVPVFMKKRESAAFQAADLLAYEHRLANKRIFDTGVGILGMEDLRGALQALDKIPHEDDDWGIYDLPALEMQCSKNNYTLREPV